LLHEELQKRRNPKNPRALRFPSLLRLPVLLKPKDSDKLKDANPCKVSKISNLIHPIPYFGQHLLSPGCFQVEGREKLLPRNPVAKDKVTVLAEKSLLLLPEATRLPLDFTTLSIFREVHQKKSNPRKLVMSFQSYSLESFVTRFRRNPSRTPSKWRRQVLFSSGRRAMAGL